MAEDERSWYQKFKDSMPGGKDFPEAKKRAGSTPTMAIPAPLPGPGGIGRAAVGAGARAIGKALKGDKKAPKTPKSPKTKKPTEPRDSGTFTSSRRMGDAKKSRGPFGSLVKRPDYAVKKYGTESRQVMRPDSGGRAIVKRENNLPAVAGSRSSVSRIPGGPNANIGLTGAARGAAAGKSGSGVGAAPVPNLGTPKGNSEEKKRATFGDKGVRKPTSSYSKPVPKPKAKPADIKEPKLPNLSVGTKKKAAPKAAPKSEPKKPSFKGNWVNAAPTAMQRKAGMPGIKRKRLFK